jgi:glycosyltransferase involved in cell wall biosynthesis
MRLLITTQKVDINDDVLGFFHGWLSEFAKHCEQVTVICLYKGEYDLPENVKVLSLGKENYDAITLINANAANRECDKFYLKLLKKINYIFRFYKYIWRERNNYDTVFVHMNAEYVVLGGGLWKIWRKKIFLWYTHKAVNCKLRIAERLVDGVFTASPESFGIKSKKAKSLGHGTNLKQFLPEKKGLGDESDIFKIVYVGRISKIKNQELLIRAIDILVNKKNIKNIKVNLIGGVIYPADNDYYQFLNELIKTFKVDEFVSFSGSIPNRDIACFYQANDLSINLCPTGGMDKAVLESWASGVPCIVLNKTFAPMLQLFPELILTNNEPEELANRIKDVISLENDRREQIKNFLLKEVSEKHSLEKLILHIVKLMS